MRHGSATAAGIILAALMVPTWAQDTPGAQEPQTATVIKGKAPLSRTVLKVRLPRPRSFTLANGATVYLLENHKYPSVRISISMKAGSLMDAKQGVAETTAGLMADGTTTRDFKKLAEEFEAAGVSVSCSAGTTTATVSMSCLTDTLDKGLELMSDVLLHPAFPQDRLDRMKQSQRSQTGQRRSNPAGLMSDLSSRVYYGGTVYDRTSATADQVGAVTRDDLVAFHKGFYIPNGAIIGVTGDIRQGALKSRMETALAEWKAGPENHDVPIADVAAKGATRVYIVDRPASAQTVLGFGNVAVARQDPDYIPLVVANRILGGGSSARLFQTIREKKGYTYGAYSALAAGQWPGTWTASASVRTEVTEAAAREFLNEFNRLQDEPVPAEELARAKQSIVGSFALTLESSEGLLSRTLELVQGNLPLDYWDTYPARVQAVTAEDVQRVARKYLGKGRVQILAVGERKAIEEGLSRLGPVEIVDPASLSGGRGGGRRGR